MVAFTYGTVGAGRHAHCARGGTCQGSTAQRRLQQWQHYVQDRQAVGARVHGLVALHRHEQRGCFLVRAPRRRAVHHARGRAYLRGAEKSNALHISGITRAGLLRGFR